jgi:flagellar biosynthesis/type III secretory pathway protein FliH
MEKTLTQQLEDKKKALLELEKNGTKKEGYACGEDFTYWEFPSENQKIFHYVLEAEIAIIEQAIAEIKNIKDIQDAREQEAYAKGFGEGFEKGKEDARQEILGLIQSEFNMKTETLSLKRFEEIKEKLNQPKTTQ